MKTSATRRIDSDTQSVGEVLRKPFFYRVPANQRDFAWTFEEIDILWEDITSPRQFQAHLGGAFTTRRQRDFDQLLASLLVVSAFPCSRARAIQDVAKQCQKRNNGQAIHGAHSEGRGFLRSTDEPGACLLVRLSRGNTALSRRSSSLQGDSVPAGDARCDGEPRPRRCKQALEGADGNFI